MDGRSWRSLLVLIGEREGTKPAISADCGNQLIEF
jgi:hypothetical protein